MNSNKFFTTATIAKIAIISAISYVLMLFSFPIPFIPPFYSLDFSEVAVLIGGFSLGPLAAVIIEALKNILKAMTGTNTAYVGELANFIIGCALCVPASIIYKKNKTKKGAIIGFIVGGAIMTLVGVIMNYFVLLPAYSVFFKLDMDKIIAIGTAIVPLIKDKLTFVLLATTPFNIVKSIVIGTVTFVLYKHISPLLKKIVKTLFSIAQSFEPEKLS